MSAAAAFSEFDPALPDLIGQLAPARVAAQAESVFGAGDRRGAPVVLACRRVDTVYQPGTRCRASYQLDLRWPAAAERLFGVLDVTPSDAALTRYDSDPALPGLTAAIDAAYMLSRIVPAAPPGTRCHVTPVRHRAGSRSVLRYDLTPRGARTRPPRFFAKIHATDADRHAAVLTGLYERSLTDPRLPHVPPVHATLLDLAMVIQPEASGAELVRRGADAPDDAMRRFAQAGRALAALHASTGPPGPAWTVTDELDELRDYLPIVRQAQPGLASRMARVIDQLAGAAPTAVASAPAHGSFRPDHARTNDEGLVLLDLDTYCWADPARDVGNLLAFLIWRDIRGRAAVTEDYRRAFLDGYSGSAADPRMRWWEAAALVKIAGRRYRRLAVAEWPLAPELLDVATARIRPHEPAATTTASPTRHVRQAGQTPQVRTGAVPDLVRRLTDARDNRRMTGLLGPILAKSSSASAKQVEVVANRVVAEKPGVRAVLRYEVRGLPDRAAVYAKLYADAPRAARVGRTLRQLTDLYAGSTGLRVPEPLGIVPKLGMLITAEARGNNLETLDGGAARRGAAAAGRWLATLHDSPVLLDRVGDLRQEVAEWRLWAQTVVRNCPAAASEADDLIGRLTAAADRLGPAERVPIHRDFHHQHVLVGDGVTVVDLDEMRMGDPALDVAHFCAYLTLWVHRRRADVWPLHAAFLGGYGEIRRLPPAASMPLMTASAWLKISKQLVTGRGLPPHPSGHEREAELRWALRKGLSCLPS